MSKETNFSGSIALTKLVHVKRQQKSAKTGKMIDVLIIPIDANYLEQDKNGGVYIPISGRLTEEEDKYGQNGFISKRLPSDVYKSASEELKNDREKTPILGNVKVWGSGSANTNTGQVDESNEVDADDDLPF